jgi:Phage integrase family
MKPHSGSTCLAKKENECTEGISARCLQSSQHRKLCRLPHSLENPTNPHSRMDSINIHRTTLSFVRSPLAIRERTLVLLAASTGLRQSELFGLKWRDINFANRLIHVTRSIVCGVVGPCKTESSQKPVPVHSVTFPAVTHRTASYKVRICALSARRSTQ